MKIISIKEMERINEEYKIPKDVRAEKEIADAAIDIPSWWINSDQEEKVIIKPCPHCGGEAKILQKTSGYSERFHDIRNGYIVVCEKCKIQTPTCESRIWQDAEGCVHIDRNGAVDALDLWNERKSEE